MIFNNTPTTIAPNQLSLVSLYKYFGVRQLKPDLSNMLGQASISIIVTKAIKKRYIAPDQKIIKNISTPSGIINLHYSLNFSILCTVDKFIHKNINNIRWKHKVIIIFLCDSNKSVNKFLCIVMLNFY